MPASNPNKTHWLSKSGFGDIYIWSVISSLSGVSRCSMLYLSSKNLVIQPSYTCEQVPLNLRSKSNNFKYRGNLSYHLLPYHLYKMKLNLYISFFIYLLSVYGYGHIQCVRNQRMICSSWFSGCQTGIQGALPSISLPPTPHSFTKVVSLGSQTAITSYQQHRTLLYNTDFLSRIESN